MEAQDNLPFRQRGQRHVRPRQRFCSDDKRKCAASLDVTFWQRQINNDEAPIKPTTGSVVKKRKRWKEVKSQIIVRRWCKYLPKRIPSIIVHHCIGREKKQTSDDADIKWLFLLSPLSSSSETLGPTHRGKKRETKLTWDRSLMYVIMCRDGMRVAFSVCHTRRDGNLPRRCIYISQAETALPIGLRHNEKWI